LTHNEGIIGEKGGLCRWTDLCALLTSTKVDESGFEVFNLPSLVSDEMSEIVVRHFEILYILGGSSNTISALHSPRQNGPNQDGQAYTFPSLPKGALVAPVLLFALLCLYTDALLGG
jgi:hypothetical protein